MEWKYFESDTREKEESKERIKDIVEMRIREEISKWWRR